MLHMGDLHHIARTSMPPEKRLEFFVNGETRLTWTSLFFDTFPHADVYLVGGTVRDILLGKTPNDIDLVIRNVEPELLETWLVNHGAAEFVGRFGTYKFVPHGSRGKEPIDIALPRTESIGSSHSSASRDITVAFDHTLSIKDDLARRDFTINAMAYDLQRQYLIDPFLGIEDLHRGIVSAVLVPEQRFHEDASRMLRGLRFACQLGFAIESLTWRAIVANIHLLNTTSLQENGTHRYSVPRETIGKEFLLGFLAHPIHTLRLWSESKALHLFMPQLAGLEDDEGSAFLKTVRALNVLQKKELLTSYGFTTPPGNVLVAVLLAFQGEDEGKTAHQICVNLHFHQFPTDHKAYIDCNRILWLLKHVQLFEKQDPASMPPSQFERLFLHEHGRELFLLMHTLLIATGTHSVARERLHTARKLWQHMQRHIQLEGEQGVLPPLLKGRDLLEAGLEPGPHIRVLLDAVRDAQLAGTIHTTQEALGIVRNTQKQLP